MSQKKAIIIGAGPAGLTAACELLKKTKVKPVILEMTDKVGGISRTEEFKGNRIDIGGHRFFTKHNAILEWWLDLLPLQGAPAIDDMLLNAGVALSTIPGSPDPERTDEVMLVRKRYSRILFNNCFFEYPLSFNWQTLSDLGIGRSCLIVASYIKSQLFPVRHEESLEDFLANRFGRQLFKIFFKDYTEKLWGVPCDSILPDWGIQRVKGLSIATAISHAFKKRFLKNRTGYDENTETSLIDEFLYPKLGSGQLWETVAERVRAGGGEIYLNHKVVGLRCSGSAVSEAHVENSLSGETFKIKGDYFISTMPVKYLIKGLRANVPEGVKTVAADLYYRDLIVVGLLLKQLKMRNNTGRKALNNMIPDSWIYIQDRNVKVGRIQLFNNWNPYMVAKKDTIWMGLEICCSDKDAIWRSPDVDIALSAAEEMARLDILSNDDVLDWFVIRQPKAYPGYTGAYKKFDVIKAFTDSLHNLFLIGRNGMHRYNNMDHSMLTAMKAVDNIITGNLSKANIWDVNIDYDYHEVK